MKIKKLEMCGFKSFVDRTVIHFDHDVLGIVGPNGCGKSNIVDAIRWCMGEQSAKHLRGKSMDDVIFSGSDTRPGHEFAEVTLVFENNDGDAPIEYRDYPEIAVTRRIHRNGDSEYLINRTQVRLKDVTDLFLGTGAGTKAYSIVEQGKIGLIVSAKPEDRRLLIEEAAGITKFKSKKKQAEKKMELTQQNLLRVGDIVAEIERNLGSLKRQAAKAERFISYRNELEDLQLHEAAHKFLELTGWVKLEKGEVERFTLDADEAKSALTAREAELEGARLEALGAEEALLAIQTASVTADNTVRDEQGAIARASDKLSTLKQREVQAEREAGEYKEQVLRLTQEGENVQAEVSRFEDEESRLAEIAAEEEERLADLHAEQVRAEATLTGLRRESGEAQTRIAGADAKLTGFERRRNDMHTRLERLRGERDQLEGAQMEHAARARELTQTVEDLRTGKQTSSDQKGVCEARLAELRQLIVGQEKALDEAKNELSKKRSRMHALLEMQSRLEGIGTGAKSLMATKDPTILGLVADRLDAPKELIRALAGLLGSRLQDVVVGDAVRGEALLHQMAQARKGRATILPLAARRVAGTTTELPALEGVVGRLFDSLRFAEADEALVHGLVGDAVVVNDNDAAKALFATGFDAAIVTLDGTVFHADGRISGGQGEDLAAGMLESKRETRELAEEVTRLEDLVSKRLAEHQASRAAIAETQTALDRARHQAHSDELALVTTEKDLRQSQQQLETVRKRYEVIAGEQDELTYQLQEASVERDETRAVLDEARAALEEVTTKVRDAETRAAMAREQVEARRQVVTERKVRVAGMREKLNAAKGTLLRLARSAEELNERLRRLGAELHEGAKAYGETAALLFLHREKLQEGLDVARDLSTKLTAARTLFDQVRSALALREGELKSLRARAEAARDALTAHEMNLREKEIALTHLLEGVAEKFRGLHLPRVIGDYHMRPAPDAELRDRIAQLAQLIERMGSVNLEAVREHAEAEKRYAFYSEQKADIEKALADLEKAITQMNRESKRLFEETFNAINEKFQELFPRMFRGGRASLRLTNPEDMLETGIDILAQPPGKKLSSIELMSGGEKALTAVSLIFAIFQIKPSPFCILDEVDAPLDEANVARYNEAIRSMTDRSQFILITHIKRTMQLVDVLYGVTMPEAGVSKLVSVKMNEHAVQHGTAKVGAHVA